MLCGVAGQPIDPDAQENWQDLDVMTSLWRVVSSGDMTSLKQMVEQNAGTDSRLPSAAAQCLMAHSLAVFAVR